MGHYRFNNWVDLETLKDALIEKETHLANEALIISLMPVGDGRKSYPRPILVSPICCHSNDELIRSALSAIIASFDQLNPLSTILNVATDGDSSRRLTLNSMRQPQTHLKCLLNLDLFDQNLLLGKYGINFDAKHIVKRLRSLIISTKRNIKLIKTSVSRFQLTELFKSSIPSNLINVKDKQNVTAAVELLILINEKTKPHSEETSVCDTRFQRDAYRELQLFGIISHLLCSIFRETKISLIDQLVNLSYLSHILLFVYRRQGTSFLTNALYSDIQSTIQDAFVCAAVYIEQNSDLLLFLYMLGTDQLEGLFATIRTLTHASNCDLLELHDRLKIAMQLEKVNISLLSILNNF